MNITNNGRLFTTTALLLLVATMASPAAFADQVATSSGPGNLATNIQVEKGQCGQVDLMFVIDDTGSMAGAIDNVKANLGPIMTQADLADADTARVGLITFKDNVTVLHDLSANRTAVEASIAALTATGGGGFPEAGNEAKNTAVNNLAAGARADVDGNPGSQTGSNTAPWQAPGPNMANIMVFITDADQGGFDNVSSPADKAQMGTLGTAAKAKAIKVSDLNVAFSEIASTADPMKADAANSNGFYKFSANGVDTAQAIIDIIAACGGDDDVAGELLPLNTTSLFISGLFANSFWMLPAMAGIAGAGAYLVKSRMHKD